MGIERLVHRPELSDVKTERTKAKFELSEAEIIMVEEATRCAKKATKVLEIVDQYLLGKASFKDICIGLEGFCKVSGGWISRDMISLSRVASIIEERMEKQYNETGENRKALMHSIRARLVEIEGT